MINGKGVISGFMKKTKQYQNSKFKKKYFENIGY